MNKLVTLGLLGLCLSGSMLAEPPQIGPPQSFPQGQGPMRPDGRPYPGRGFGMHDESARILPMGTWWKDPDLIGKLELTPDQQKRLDDLFVQNKVSLVRMHASLDEEQLQLQPMLNANPVDDAKVLAEIGKIADMRADLEKATARMLLQMRGVLTQPQWTRLQQERPSGMRQHMFMRGPDGPHSRMDWPGEGGVRAEP